MSRKNRPAVNVDRSALQRRVGYCSQRTYLAILDRSKQHVTKHDLPQGAFAVLVLLHHNPGLSSLQICNALGVQPPNLVALVAGLEARSMIERKDHPHDARSMSLYLTPSGRRLLTRMERAVEKADREATAMLSDEEREILLSLLCRIFTGTTEATDKSEA